MSTLTEARQALQRLVERYRKSSEDKNFLSNEKQICQILIIPFVRDVLHWDTEDSSEFKLEESRAGKRPDYIFYHQGMTQFILEAKAASKDLFEDEAAMLQALEYGYNADKDFVILTNFRQLLILAPRVQYERSVKEAAIARINLLETNDTDLQLLLAFEKEYWLSSGKNNLLYQKLIHHKKTVPVDDRLLDDMRKWREILLTNIKKKNLKLNFDDEQDFAEIEKEVQKFIDRLVFICCCEDKGIHHEPTLKQLHNEKASRHALNPGWLLDQIRALFAKYRKVPDSDLFDMSPADKYDIDDVKLLEILIDLRQPKGRPAYNFDEIDEDILGKVYENFIGHVQTGSKRFKEVEDRGKRKKEGIFYTPKYVVEFIVSNTVRERIKGKSFEDILKVKVLDPACGSGSFLLRAFNVLAEEASKSLKRPLKYSEKRDILLNCIYGVDLDERAVEITKLTFSLKLAQISEGLPVLADNIRHGNSLIDDRAIAGDYLAFKWEEEFKDIISKGGFDIIIGNPPYVKVDQIKPQEKEWMFKRYKTASGRTDLYILFLEKALSLAKPNGLVSFIIPSIWMKAEYGENLRNHIKENYQINSIVDFGDLRVFDNVTTYPCIITIENRSSGKGAVLYFKVSDIDSSTTSRLDYLVKNNSKKISYSDFDWNFGDKAVKDLFRKITLSSKTTLSELRDQIYEGFITGDNSSFFMSGTEAKKLKIEKELLKPVPKGKNIRRYSISWSDEYVIYPYSEQESKTRPVNLSDFEHTKSYLSQFQKKLTARKSLQGTPKKWYEYVRPREKWWFEKPKILTPNLSSRNNFAIDDGSTGQYFYVDHDAYAITIKAKDQVNELPYICGLLNSSVIEFFIKQISPMFSGGYYKYHTQYLDPIPVIEPTPAIRKKVIALVSHIISLHRKLRDVVKSESSEVLRIESAIRKADSDIDEIFFELYNIDESERAIISNALKNQ